MNKPWLKWPERWQMVDDFRRGMTIRDIAKKYRRDRMQVTEWLQEAGLWKIQRKSEVAEYNRKRQRSPLVRELCELLVRVKHAKGDAFCSDDIDKVMRAIFEARRLERQWLEHHDIYRSDVAKEVAS